MQRQNLILLADAAVVEKRLDGKIKLHPDPQHHRLGHRLGGLIGMIFFAPLVGMAVGAALFLLVTRVTPDKVRRSPRTAARSSRRRSARTPNATSARPSKPTPASTPPPEKQLAPARTGHLPSKCRCGVVQREHAGLISLVMRVRIPPPPLLKGAPERPGRAFHRQHRPAPTTSSDLPTVARAAKARWASAARSSG